MTPEIDRIEGELLACRTLAEPEVVRARHRGRVREIAKDLALRVMAIQIANLAARHERALLAGGASRSGDALTAFQI